jgi:hypothetical protein
LDNWTKIFDSKFPHRAEIARAYLAERDIEAVVINKQDSSYPVLGKHELYVPTKDANIAKFIIEHEVSFE